VRVVVKLFAGLRERAGTGTRELELPDGACAGDAWRELELGDEPSGLLYAVNKRYADRDEALADGDEVALIPPVSGGAFRLVEGPLDPAAASEEVASPEAGAIATFVGTVRRRSRDRDVRHLEYEAYPGMAEAVMEEIAAEAAARHEVTAVAIHHRTGRVEVGEPSVVVAVSARHRAAALAACAETIDALKERVPLWKKEVYEGGEEWLGRGS
jgi:molybdopterin synthase catalytic subunit